MERSFTGAPGIAAFQMLMPPLVREGLAVATNVPVPASAVTPVPNPPIDPR